MSNTFKVGDKVIVKTGREHGTGGCHSPWSVEAGKVYTIKTISVFGNLRFEEKDAPAPNDSKPPAHDPARFELAPAQAPTVPPFKVGDKVQYKGGDSWMESDAGKKVGDVLTVARVSDNNSLYGNNYPADHPYRYSLAFEELSHFTWHMRYAGRFGSAPEPVRDFRLARNGGVVHPASFKTEEAATEAARKAYSDGQEFDIVEVVTVSKHTVRKVVEARA